MLTTLALLGCDQRPKDGLGHTGDTAPIEPVETAWSETADTADASGATGDTGDTGSTGDTGVPGCPPGQALLDGEVHDTLQDALDAVAEDPALGDVTVCAGVHAGPFVARGPARLVGVGEAVLDGLGAGTTLVVAPGSALEGLTIRGGAAARGGGVLLSGPGSLEVRGCAITGNTAGSGGGLAATDATLTLVDTTIADNAATDRGGGLELDTVDATLDGVIVEENHAAEGAGAWTFRGTITGGTFRANEAALRAGGLALWFGEGADLDVVGNQADVAAGGILLVDEAVLRDFAITDNRAPLGAGVGTSGVSAYAYDGFALITGAVTGNTATGDGGGAWVDGSVFFAQDVAFSANAADRGGALAGAGTAQLQLAGGSVTANTAVAAGGGVWSDVFRFPLDANGVDFGAGATENAPDDVSLGAVSYAAYGAGATFDCDAGSCR